MSLFGSMKWVSRRLPCYHPDRPIPPPARRPEPPVRANRGPARNYLMELPLSDITQANFCDESIVQPVFTLLQGSGRVRQAPAAG